MKFIRVTEDDGIPKTVNTGTIRSIRETVGGTLIEFTSGLALAVTEGYETIDGWLRGVEPEEPIKRQQKPTMGPCYRCGHFRTVQYLRYLEEGDADSGWYCETCCQQLRG